MRSIMQMVRERYMEKYNIYKPVVVREAIGKKSQPYFGKLIQLFNYALIREGHPVLYTDWCT